MEDIIKFIVSVIVIIVILSLFDSNGTYNYSDLEGQIEDYHNEVINYCEDEIDSLKTNLEDAECDIEYLESLLENEKFITTNDNYIHTTYTCYNLKYNPHSIYKGTNYEKMCPNCLKYENIEEGYVSYLGGYPQYFIENYEDTPYVYQIGDMYCSIDTKYSENNIDDDCVVYINNDENVFHKLICTKITKNLTSYTKDLAEDIGYQPCKECFGNP